LSLLKITLRYLFFLGLTFVVSLSFAQSYYFDNYSVNDGLAQSTAYNIIQDNKGFIWIGTRSGVSRFDGTEFFNYTSADGLSINGVKTILQDNNGNIWLGHIGGGISLFDGLKFQEIKLDTNINSDISAIVEDSNENIWISTAGNGAYLINSLIDKDSVEIEFRNYTGKDGLSDRVFDIYSTPTGEVLFVTDVGVKNYIPKEDEFESFAPKELPTYFSITTIFIDREGNTWYGTYHGGLYKQVPGEKEIKIYDDKDGLASNWVSTITQDKTGNIWVGTWGGGITKITDGVFNTFNVNNGLHDTKIWDIITDREGNVLVGTHENGFDVFKGEHFVSYSSKSGVSGKQVWALAQDNNKRYWFGTNAGITILDRSNSSQELSRNKFTYLNEESNNLISNEVRFIKKDNLGRMWIATNKGIVHTLSNDDIHHFDYPAKLNSSIKLSVVTAMDIDDDNNLWVGTLDGLIYYDVDTKTPNLLTQTSGLLGNNISEVYRDTKGDVWVGCSGFGMSMISGANFNTIDLGGDYTPTVINEDKEGNIWIGTDGQGVIVYNQDSGIIAEYHVENGLLTDLITSISIDDNNIWIGTNKGLNKIDRSTNTIYTYGEKDGFTGIENKLRASYKDQEGNLWFGTVKGVTVYKPKKDYTKIVNPKTILTQLRVNLNNWNLEWEPKFTYKDKSFHFDYKAVYLANPSSVRYKTMMKGVDDDWLPATDLTFVNYPVLPHGDYTFMVKASASSGEWSGEIATYSFVISPPLWKTWWFYLFCLLFIGIGIFYFIKARERNLLLEKRILEEKIAERTAEVVEKNDELASKNKDITDSIRYAKRIQQAILPPDELIEKFIPDSFVLFKPKDIVSGDFYWIDKLDDTVFFSAIDCTGHGVPGAFMSIIGYNSLDKIINELRLTQPAEILDELNRNVSDILRQKGDDNTVKDGMDMALVSIDYKNLKVGYAGANNPLYIFRDGELIETKADKFAIGSFISGEKKGFKNHEFDLKKGDVIYLFSDGFPDQFGGPKGKKYMYKSFKGFLKSIHLKPMNEQHDLLEKEFISWIGPYEQIDDVIIMGTRL